MSERAGGGTGHTERAPVRLLVNPAAGRGLALRRLEAARHALLRAGPLDIVTTAAPGDEARLAREAARDRVRALVVLGGDGTVSRVASALVEAGADTPLAIFGAGTGNDLAKSLGAPVFDYAAMTERVRAGVTRGIDTGTVDGRVFVNALGFGFDVAVLERTLRARWLRGNALYAVTALGELFRYGGFEARLTVDAGDVVAHAGRWLTIVIANGQWFGGAFRIAPDAMLDDGLLDVVAIGDVSPFRRARLFGAAPWGRHVRAPEVRYAQARRLTLEFPEPSWYQADGEMYRADDARVVIETGAGTLRVIA